MPIQQAAKQIIGFAVAHDISPLAQVIEGSPEEHALQRLGWVSTDQPTAVLVSRLADFLAVRPAAPTATITETLQPGWEAAYQHSRPNSADPAIVRMILEESPSPEPSRQWPTKGPTIVPSSSRWPSGTETRAG